jgi:LysR family hydrogen peroxide-inducible transcriptional activator
MVKLRQLEYLVAIADTGSFGQAAIVTNTSQPTLSQQIRVLEDELGVQLLERRSGGAIATPVGRSVIDRARSILRDVRELKADAQGGRSQLSGTLRLGTTPTLGPYLLSPFIADLHQHWPDLRLYVREGIPNLQALELVRGGIDLHLGPLPIVGEGLTVEPLFREPLLPVVAIHHPLARAAEVSVRDLKGLVMLSIDPRHHYHHQLTQVAHEHGMTVSPDYEGTSLDSLHQMVASGLGITLLPSLYLASEVGGSSSIRILRIPEWRAYRSIALAWRNTTPLGEQYALLAGRIATMASGLLAQFDARDRAR